MPWRRKGGPRRAPRDWSIVSGRPAQGPSQGKSARNSASVPRMSSASQPRGRHVSVAGASPKPGDRGGYSNGADPARFLLSMPSEWPKATAWFGMMGGSAPFVKPQGPSSLADLVGAGVSGARGSGPGAEPQARRGTRLPWPKAILSGLGRLARGLRPAGMPPHTGANAGNRASTQRWSEVKPPSTVGWARGKAGRRSGLLAKLPSMSGFVKSPQGALKTGCDRA